MLMNPGGHQQMHQQAASHQHVINVAGPTVHVGTVAHNGQSFPMPYVPTTPMNQQQTQFSTARIQNTGFEPRDLQMTTLNQRLREQLHARLVNQVEPVLQRQKRKSQSLASICLNLTTMYSYFP